MTPSLPLPVVLDTNVVLDLFAFDDPHARPLAEALDAGTLVAWADADTLAELGYVLASRNFRPGWDAAARQVALERYRALVRVVPEGEGTSVPELPRCRDRDDQKFLLLAARAGAAWLVSKDKRVLSMAGRGGLPFLILTVRQAVEWLRAPRPVGDTVG
ncbi:PIN domain-containing protein [Pyxidicoccus fallax]|uniref:PIN domain-containing protein n=1 Tax=Pyxidicoccus fallax TaxID=394095 RepID=A0A848LAA2_9BACT|nr:PIN domain-containing protein [Pyxidicoccus fallax]NMO15444.1 PIN domain-containing protein [Pyxidicoccus fallax]NPC83180.1 PIN domain-containing protein [Pyxidicoccus fallax]